MNRIPLLVATKGALAQEGLRYEIPEGEGIRLGRANDCEITIPNSNVSRYHAKVQLHNDGIWVQDNNSRNGVFVGGKRVVRPKELRPGVEMEVGDHVFVLEITEVSDDDPSVVRAIELSAVKQMSRSVVPMSWLVVGLILMLCIGLFFVFSS